MSADLVPCPACGTDVRGRFCPACGTLAREATCRTCSAAVAAGEKFCGECGTPVAAVAAPAASAGEPWRPTTTWKVMTAALALTLVVALYMRFAGDGAPTASAAGPQASSGGSMADVLSMPPQQQADRLFNRVMRLSEEGKQDSVALFAPMAIQVYEQLQPWDQHQRFDVGTVALAGGMHAFALAQADSIVRKDPDHLLGLALLSRVGRAIGDSTLVREADARFARIAGDEERKAAQKTEYQDHKGDIEAEKQRLAAKAP